MSVRDDIVALAKSYDGVSVSSSKDRYVELLGPGEAANMQAYFCDPKTSGCGLTVRGLWRKSGVTDKRVLPPYKFGTAISLLVGVARDRRAWINAKPGKTPKPGDFVLVGGDPTKDGGVEHVYTVCSVEPQSDGSVILTSVDGGQRDAKGQEAIYGKGRRWTVRNGSYWDVSHTGSDPGAGVPGGRRVQGWGDIEVIVAVESPASNNA